MHRSAPVIPGRRYPEIDALNRCPDCGWIGKMHIIGKASVGLLYRCGACRRITEDDRCWWMDRAPGLPRGPFFCARAKLPYERVGTDGAAAPDEQPSCREAARRSAPEAST